MGMRTCLLMVGVLVMGAVGCRKSASPVIVTQPVKPSAPVSATPAVTQPVVAPAPVVAAQDVPETFGWKPYDEESFTTGPSQGRVFDVPVHATKLRVKVRASQDVFAGVMTQAQFSTRRGVVRAGNFLSLPCGIVGRAGGERTCALDPLSPEVFVLRDVREQQMMVDPRVKPGENRITVALSVWACVEHCRQVPK